MARRPRLVSCGGGDGELDSEESLVYLFLAHWTLKFLVFLCIRLSVTLKSPRVLLYFKLKIFNL